MVADSNLLVSHAVPCCDCDRDRTPPCRFTSKECIVTKVFGEADEKVLFNFDGSQAPDMNSIIAKVLAQCCVLMLAQPSAANRKSDAKQAGTGAPDPLLLHLPPAADH